VSRLPTDTEKRLTLGLVGKSADRKAAWLAGECPGDHVRQVDVA